MMLDWLGEPAAARRLERAVSAALAAGHGTPDIGGSLRTDEMAAAVSAAL